MTAAPRTSDRWLFGPVPDLFLGCGALYLTAFAALSLAGTAWIAHRPGWLMPLLVMLFSMPHYGGTLVRVYEERRDRRAYAVFTVWTTLAIFALFAVGVHNAYVGSILLTVYLTWSPWHYTGQNYGLALLFLRRRGVAVDAGLKRWIYASFALSYAITFLVMHSGERPAGYDPLSYRGTEVVLLPLGISPAVAGALVPLAGIAYLGATAVAGARLLRRARAAEVLPAALLALTQAVWFSVPFAVRHFGWTTGLAPFDRQFEIQDYVLWTFLGHGIQYLWVTTYYARAAQRWSGYTRYLGKVAVSGIAIWTLPFLVFMPDGLGRVAADSGLALLVAAAVNIHHFVLDGAIWKLRNTRIAGVLIRSERESEPVPAGPGGWRRLVWAVAIAGLAVGVFEYWQYRIVLPRAVAARDYPAAVAILDRLAWFGYDRAQRRRDLGHALVRAGDLEAARAQFARSLELTPSGDTSALLGLTEERLGRTDRAEALYRQALAQGVKRADLPHAGLARLALADGRPNDAIDHYREAARLNPRAEGYRSEIARLVPADPVEPASEAAGSPGAGAHPRRDPESRE
jgi:tetratricopeptide (TPR) repeat protein